MTTTQYNTINKIADGAVERLEDLNIRLLESSFVQIINNLNYVFSKPDIINENIVSKFGNLKKTVNEIQGLRVDILGKSNYVYNSDINYNLNPPIEVSENLVTKPTTYGRIHGELNGLLFKIFQKSADRRTYNINIKIIKPKKTYLIKGIRIYKKYYPTIKY